MGGGGQEQAVVLAGRYLGPEAPSCWPRWLTLHPGLFSAGEVCIHWAPAGAAERRSAAELRVRGRGRKGHQRGLTGESSSRRQLGLRPPLQGPLGGPFRAACLLCLWLQRKAHS